MKKLVFYTVCLSILAFACTDNPLFKIALDIPYNTSYTIKASDQVDGKLVLESDENSYDGFLSRVQEELDANGVSADFTAEIIFLELTIPETSEIDWTILGEVTIDFYVNGEPSNLLDGISFEGVEGKVLKVGLPADGISINDFLNHESASLKITADLAAELLEDVPLDVSAEVKVSSKDTE
ncbi:MAG: hypothetical protein AAF696_38760 [Bacteroidota bacterium]